MNSFFKQLQKIRFYVAGHLSMAIPDAYFQRKLADTLVIPNRDSAISLRDRLEYYHRISTPFRLPDDIPDIGSISSSGFTAYFLDYRQTLRWFPPHLRAAHLFGDVRHVPPVPTIVKSRPIGDENANSVLLKLNRIRHFTFVKGDLPFARKQDVVVWRGKCYGKANRTACVERYHATPGCDIGDMNPRLKGAATWKPYLSIANQLRCKFILSIEGNDVATNLKWILSSNSLCFMSRPRYETWFMEGRLIPNHHYVLVRDDYADLLEKRDHYLAHPEEAAAIIANAHRHVDQFRDRRREELLGLLVMRKYFALSGQWDGPDPLADP